MFPYGNIGGFPGNNQTIIKYKYFICLSNFQFNYLWDRGTHRTQHLCSPDISLCTKHTSVFVANLGSPLDDGCRKAMQSVITDFRGHDMCMSLTYGHETLTDVTEYVVLRRKFD